MGMEDEKKVAQRKWYLETTYGMTPEEYDAKLAEGKCVLCEGSDKLRMNPKAKVPVCRKCVYLIQQVKANKAVIVKILRNVHRMTVTEAKK